MRLNRNILYIIMISFHTFKHVYVFTLCYFINPSCAINQFLRITMSIVLPACVCVYEGMHIIKQIHTVIASVFYAPGALINHQQSQDKCKTMCFINKIA